MKKLALLLLSLSSFSQTQIGADIDGESAGDSSGYSVSTSSNGSIIAIGARYNSGNGLDSGSVRVFKNINGSWIQIGGDIDGETAGDLSGNSISLSSDGNIIAIGSRSNDGNGTDSGSVRIFQNLLNIWTQIGSDIDGDFAGDLSGNSLALSNDGSIIAIGALGSGLNLGSVKVFHNNNGVWMQIGSNINSQVVGDFTGWSLALSANGNIVAIGSTYSNGNGLNSGSVRVFQNINGVWTQIGIDINGESPGDLSGFSVSISSDGNIIAIGAPYNDDNGLNSGSVRVFQNINGTWVQIGSDIDGESPGDLNGNSISLSSNGTILAIAARSNDDNGSNSGSVRVFKKINNIWTKVGIDIDGEAIGDLSGSSISLSTDGSTVSIGAPGNDGNGLNSGSVRVYDLTNTLKTSTFKFDNFFIFPNPTKDNLIIKLNFFIPSQKIIITDILGKTIHSQKLEGLTTTINTSSFEKGIYVISLINATEILTKKFIKE